MLKLKNPTIQIQPSSTHQEDGGKYYRGTLLPLMRESKWSEIQQYPVIHLPNGKSIEFGSDKWNLISLDKENRTCLNFRYKGKRLSSKLVNELKTVTLARIFTGRKKITAPSLSGWVNDMKLLILVMANVGLDSFSQLTDKKLKDIAALVPYNFDTPKKACAINVLIDYYEELPFEISFSKQTVAKLGIKVKRPEQYLVIPPRIYTALLGNFSAEVNDLMPHLQQIQNEITRLLKLKKKYKEYLLKRFRCGEIPNPFQNNDTFEKVIAKYEEEGILLIDDLKGEQHSPGRWMQLINQLKPGLISFAAYAKNSTWNYEPFKVGSRKFDKVSEFNAFLSEYDMKCKALCLLLSGMRVDELNSMHPTYGAQSYIYKGQMIHLFTTRQSKITHGKQTEEDTFVTNQTGHNAFRLLTTIHRPFLEQINEDSKVGFFAAILKSNFPEIVTKSGWSCSLASQVNRWIEHNVGSLISAEDESFLHISNPLNAGCEAGTQFKFSNHQTRRSFAFYMIGLELMAFPQLKKQLSHISSAMTRHYANNASYWGSLRTEIQQERTLQKSRLLATVYKRLAKGGTIAGGKGKALKKLAGSKNYFENGKSDRRLNPEYWEKRLRDSKEHIHAIAPGMYCTNAQCDMRINVALDECVDCEFDVIMDGLYAEGRRLAAHRNLVILDEMNDLNHSVVSQLVVVIKSCERILNELEIPFTAIEIPKNINEMLIITSPT